MKPLTLKLSFNAGVGLERDRALFVMVVDDIAHDPEKPHCIVYRLQGDEVLDLGAFGFNSVAICSGFKENELLVLGYFGELGLIRADGNVETTQLPNSRGPMRFLKEIDNAFFAVGTQLQVFKSHDTLEWQDVGPNSSLLAQYDKQHLERIDGYDCNEIYATGSDGVLWYFDGKRWYPIECPTNARFLDVVCAPDGFVYACGEFGTIVKGRYDSFELVVTDPKVTSLWGIEYFDSRIYASGITALMTLDTDMLVPEFEAMALSDSFYDLNVSDDNTLWSIGAKDVMTLRDGAWSRIDQVKVL